MAQQKGGTTDITMYSKAFISFQGPPVSTNASIRDLLHTNPGHHTTNKLIRQTQRKVRLSWNSHGELSSFRLPVFVSGQHPYNISSPWPSQHTPWFGGAESSANTWDSAKRKEKTLKYTKFVIWNSKRLTHWSSTYRTRESRGVNRMGSGHEQSHVMPHDGPTPQKWRRV